MVKRTLETKYPENPPDWYWKNGLHDACIIGVETYEPPFDYDTYKKQSFQYDRNILELSINAKGAMFDCHVTKIRFFNYRILDETITLTNRKKIWWLADQLTETNGKYELDILLEDFDSFPEEFHFKLRFDRAEVERE